jgi:tRNA uridine 5-carboxymethylaminomethyl modification enzyme
VLDWARRPTTELADVMRLLDARQLSDMARDPRIGFTVMADLLYAGYLDRQRKQIDQLARQEQQAIPAGFDYQSVAGLRNEAKQTLAHFQPATLGQASRLAGVTPADCMVLAIATRHLADDMAMAH